jgi:hypothetical protein
LLLQLNFDDIDALSAAPERPAVRSRMLALDYDAIDGVPIPAAAGAP